MGVHQLVLTCASPLKSIPAAADQGSSISIHNKKLGADFRERPVWLGAVRHLIAQARRERELPTIFQLRAQYTFHAKKDVTFRAPVIGQIPGGIFDHAHPYRPEILRPPKSDAAFPWVRGLFNCRPICSAEWDV